MRPLSISLPGDLSGAGHARACSTVVRLISLALASGCSRTRCTPPLAASFPRLPRHVPVDYLNGGGALSPGSEQPPFLMALRRGFCAITPLCVILAEVRMPSGLLLPGPLA
eukprot:4079910-Alexandrium_andersonii.AAC.1